MSEWWAFATAGIRGPGKVGAVAPSSHRLAEQLAVVVPTMGAPVVAELGAGTGAITRAIQRRLPSAGRLVVLDSSVEMVEVLRRRHPDLDIENEDAANLGTVLAKRSITGVDAVISGLPWALLGESQQQRILTEVASALRPHAAFVTFAYSHAKPLQAARRFRRSLNGLFDEVIITRTTWRNAPPAFCYVCRRGLPRWTQP